MSTAGEIAASPVPAAYLTAFTDWVACAAAGAGERAAVATRDAGSDLLAAVAFAGTAGHVLDYDDTFPAGVAHVSAATAPAALVLAAERGLSVGAALEAYAEGFEAMAAVAAASHPALYDGGWHPTAVCGPIGAAVAAARILGLPKRTRRHAVRIGLLRAGGGRGAFGSDGKAIQVGLASAAGVQGALLARAGAEIAPGALEGPLGFTGVLGARWAEPGAKRAIDATWIKLHPSCLGTHAPIEAAAELRGAGGATAGPLTVAVNPVARQAAHIDLATDGLEAKFSIPYCVALTLAGGPPSIRDFAAVDPDLARRAEAITVVLDAELPPWGAVLRDAQGTELARVPCPLGAPERPVAPEQLRAKLRDLAGEELLALCAEPGAAAETLRRAAGLAPDAAARLPAD
jgi:2-methylcitrate dehydratase PrpD